jgi:hypothetical protein
MGPCCVPDRSIESVPVRVLFPQDVLEIIFEFAGNFADLLRLRQVANAWRDGTRAVADFHRRTGRACARKRSRDWSLADPADFLAVHPRLMSVNVGMTAWSILRAAVVLMPGTLDQLSVAHVRHWYELMNFVNRRSRPVGGLANLIFLRLTGSLDVELDEHKTVALAGIPAACPRLQSLIINWALVPARVFATVAMMHT